MNSLSSGAPQPTTWGPRFELLDGLRGVAAVLVVIHHIGYGRGFNLGHYAVLIFFVISGYCVTAAADSCRRHQLSAGAYMWRRVRRIYPPYFFALLFFLATRLLKLRLGMGDQLGHGWLYWTQNFTLTQWLTLVRTPATWASNNPTLPVVAFWSLNYEEQFYVVLGIFAFASRWLGRHSITAGHLTLLALGVIWNVAAPSTSTGLFVEYWVPFGAGGLLYAYFCGGLSSRARAGMTGLLAALAAGGLALFVTRTAGDGVHSRSAFLEWSIACGFALVLRFARPFSGSISGQKWYRPFALLGLISYSLYLVHQFNLRFAETAIRRLLHSGTPVPVSVAAQVALLVAVAAMFWFFFERPFLNRSLTEEPPKVATAFPAEGSGT